MHVLAPETSEGLDAAAFQDPTGSPHGRVIFPLDIPTTKNPPAQQEAGLIPESGSSPEKGNGNPLQNSLVGNSTDRGAWRAVVHGVPESQHDLALNKKNLSYSSRDESVVRALGKRFSSGSQPR